MIKSVPTLVAATVLSLALAAQGFAQTAEQARSPTVAAAGQGMRSSKLIGTPVYNGQGEKIGTIQELLVKSGSEPSAVLSVGDFIGTGEKLVAVPLSHVTLESGKVTMPTATKEHLASMQVYLFPPAQYGG